MGIRGSREQSTYLVENRYFLLIKCIHRKNNFELNASIPCIKNLMVCFHLFVFVKIKGIFDPPPFFLNDVTNLILYLLLYIY